MASGQAIIEFIVLTALFMLLLAGAAKNIPLTFESATPYLGGQVEARLQTGVGFAQSQQSWETPKSNPRGGMRDL